MKSSPPFFVSSPKQKVNPAFKSLLSRGAVVYSIKAAGVCKSSTKKPLFFFSLTQYIYWTYLPFFLPPPSPLSSHIHPISLSTNFAFLREAQRHPAHKRETNKRCKGILRLLDRHILQSSFTTYKCPVDKMSDRGFRSEAENEVWEERLINASPDMLLGLDRPPRG